MKNKKISEEIQNRQVIEAMEIYGGSFVKSLAKSFKHADPNNFNKLKHTFSEYWDEYAEMAHIHLLKFSENDINELIKYLESILEIPQPKIKNNLLKETVTKTLNEIPRLIKSLKVEKKK